MGMSSTDTDQPHGDGYFMQQALDLARRGLEQRDGGPFGAVVVIENKIVGRGWNQVVARNDPTAHAEILAIRDACHRLRRFHLTDATLYSSCEPCPMCLAAIHWSRIREVVFAADAEDAAAIGFNDKKISQALQNPIQNSGLKIRREMRSEALELFRQWQQDKDKTSY